MKKTSSILLILSLLFAITFTPVHTVSAATFYVDGTPVTVSINKTSFGYYGPDKIVAKAYLPQNNDPLQPPGFVQVSILDSSGNVVRGGYDYATAVGGNRLESWSSDMTFSSAPKTSGTATYKLRFFALVYRTTYPTGTSAVTGEYDIPFTVTEIPPTLTVKANGSANNITVQSMSKVNITWTVTNAISCTRKDTGAAIPVNGGVAGFDVYPEITTTYRVECTN